MKILIVVDMQNDFVTGSIGTKEAQSIVAKVKEKVELYQSNQDLVLFTRDTHYENYLETQEGTILPVEHCIFGTSGWEITEGLNFPNCHCVNKNTFGWLFWNATIKKYSAEEIESIEVVGLCTDICVISNALILKATYPEVKVTVDASCCAGTTPEMHQQALNVMRSCQVNVIGG